MLQLLTAVGSSATGLSLTEAATLAGLVPSTALRQLRSLEAAGMLVRDPDDQLYRPGPELVQLAHVVFAGQSMTVAAQPFLDALAHTTGETAYLAVAEPARRIVYLATAPGRHALRHAGWVGRSFSAATTAIGSALRGQVDDDGTTTRTDQVEPGITAIASPVRSSAGIIGGINLVGPSLRLTGATLVEARAEVALASGRLSRVLGGT